MSFLEMCNLTLADQWGGCKWSNPESPIKECQDTESVAEGATISLSRFIKSINVGLKTLRDDSYHVRLDAPSLKVDKLVSFWYGACYSLDIRRSYPEVGFCA